MRRVTCNLLLRLHQIQSAPKICFVFTYFFVTKLLLFSTLTAANLRSASFTSNFFLQKLSPFSTLTAPKICFVFLIFGFCSFAFVFSLSIVRNLMSLYFKVALNFTTLMTRQEDVLKIKLCKTLVKL